MKKGRRGICTLLTAFVLARSKMSSLIGLVKQKKTQRTSYSIDIISNIDLSIEDKFMWNKHKFERNRPSIDILIRTSKSTYNPLMKVQQILPFLLFQPLFSSNLH
jgi:hypothetical protein